MNPRYARLRPDMSVDEAISYLRRQTREHVESVYYVYVLDAEQHLLGVVSFRDLFSAPPDKRVRDVMHTDVVTVPEDMDQEAVSKLFAEHNFLAIPVVDAERRMKGIVTVDDIVDVVQEEATEDIQKLGGMEALDAPYLSVGFGDMLRKRAGWLSVLFIGEMLTATRDGLLRERDRARRGAGALRPAHHQQRRQLGLAGLHAGGPRAWRSARSSCATGGGSSGASWWPGWRSALILAAHRLRRASSPGRRPSTSTASTTS